MEISDWLASGALLISVLVALGSYLSTRYNKMIRLVELEKSFLDKIVEARFRYSDIVEKINAAQSLSDETKEVLRTFVKDRLEEYLNAIDYACDKYLRGILDKKSFPEVFGTQIKEALSNKTLFDIVMDGVSNRFKSIKKVYQELK